MGWPGQVAHFLVRHFGAGLLCRWVWAGGEGAAAATSLHPSSGPTLITSDLTTLTLYSPNNQSTVGTRGIFSYKLFNAIIHFFTKVKLKTEDSNAKQF